MSRPLRLSLLASAVSLALTGCSSLLNSYYADTVPPAVGQESLPTLHAPVKVSRDNLGIPLIEADNEDDMAFSMGYLAAEDRLAQMIGFRAMAQGRLAEMSGPALLDIDLYMRALNLRQVGQLLYEPASPSVKQLLQRYADGVNAYIARHPLPPDLDIAGMKAEPWQPQDSMTLFALLNLGLAFNSHEELAYLRVAQKVGAEKAAWLMPIYPDESLPFAEAKKLAGIDLNTGDALAQLNALQPKLAALKQRPIAASNNWAVHKSRTRDGASILANDTHLPLAMPSYWHYVHVKTPQLHAAGVAMAGIPGVVAGFNGKLAWGMTMVMADNQDVYLEQLRNADGQLQYKTENGWLAATPRQETFKIKGDKTIEHTLYDTRHGPLLNSALLSSKYPLVTQPAQHSPYGIALNWAMHEPDNSIDAFFGLMKSESVDAAEPLVRGIRAIPLNFVYADKDNIAWQVTGRYPIRKQGRGYLPSPGWTGEYDWQGYLDPALHPFKKNPAEGFLGTANHRTVPADYPHVLSSSWYYPERAESINELLQADSKHTREATLKMHYDQRNRFLVKIKPLLAEARIDAAIARLPAPDAQRAREARASLLRFDGEMSTASSDASVLSAFLHRFANDAFGDELGAPDDPAWKAFVSLGDMSYSAIPDHLLQRDDSPFWDDIRTAAKEDKADIVARALAGSIAFLQERLGNDRSQWQWGKLHTYFFETDTSKLVKEIGGLEKLGFGAISGYFNRGPYPSAGDHTTLNVSAYQIGDHFNSWLIPAMRIAVDFSRDEPMLALNSSGQSGNPVSPHYEDGIHAWLNGDYQPFPFRAENMAKQYRQTRILLPY